jgi:hypothetical protein
MASIAAAAPAPPPAPPEVKKTVDAFAGNWTFDGTVTLPGKAPAAVHETFDCRKVAGGTAVACTGKAEMKGMGSMEDVALVAWDVAGKVVRFVGASPMDFHDHRCTWKDDKTLACEPLSLTAEGQPATVDLNVSFADAKNVSIVETTTFKDGSKLVYEGKGKRK